MQAPLNEGGRGSTAAHHRVQSVLVISQVALTLVLMVGVGLLLTIRRLQSVDAGLDTQHLITLKVGVSRSLTKTAASTRAAYQQLIERIRAISGVEAADFTDIVPLTGGSGIMPFWINSQRPASIQAAPRLQMFLTGPDYLRVAGIPLLRGRFFTAQDTTTSPCVVAIDSDFAHSYFAGQDPVGQTLTVGFSAVGPCQIVGVVGHVKHFGLDDSGPAIRNQAYFPFIRIRMLGCR